MPSGCKQLKRFELIILREFELCAIRSDSESVSGQGRGGVEDRENSDKAGRRRCLHFDPGAVHKQKGKTGIP